MIRIWLGKAIFSKNCQCGNGVSSHSADMLPRSTSQVLMLAKVMVIEVFAGVVSCF